MNDRYLYRAKRTDNGEWVHGNLLEDGLTGQVFIHATGNSVNESDKVNEEGCLRFFAYEADPSTICKCTGLTDKNGKLIFEHDILLQKTTNKHWCKWECNGVVKYGEYDWNAGEYGYKSIGFYVEPIIKNGDVTKILHGLNQEYLVDKNYPYVVIGNIFDNPDLLEGELR